MELDVNGCEKLGLQYGSDRTFTRRDVGIEEFKDKYVENIIL